MNDYQRSCLKVEYNYGFCWFLLHYRVDDIQMGNRAFADRYFFLWL